MPTLTIQLPNLPPVEHVLREETVTIGRMKGNTIALDDSSVSLSHAKIMRKNSEFFLKDLNSTNGTMLNGQSINEARLRDGDQVKFGEVVGYYRAEPAPAASSSAATGTAPHATALPPMAQTVSPAAPAPVQYSAPTLSAANNPSTSFVSKRLASQAAQPNQPTTGAAPGTNPNPGGFQTTQYSRKKKTGWLLPALGGAGAIAAAGVLAWIFFGGQSAPAPNPNVVPFTAKKLSPEAVATPAPRPALKPAPGTEPTEIPSIPDLKKSLHSADAAERRRAAAALHSLGSGAKDAVPDLRGALNDSDAEVRMWSALALINNKSYDKAAIPILVQVLHHENSMLRQVSCLSLALIPYDDTERATVVAALTDTANKDDDDEVRKNAVSALKIIAPESLPGGK